MFGFDAADIEPAIIKVIAVGGGGCDAISHMIDSIDTSGWKGEKVQYIALDTDESSLRCSRATTTLLLGRHHCHGLGADGNQEVSESAAIAECEHIRELLIGADMVFIVARLGGGTGSGAAPVVAKLAHELNINITVGVVALPNTCEGELPMRRAQLAKDALVTQVDSLIVIPTDNLGSAKKASYEYQNDMMLEAVRHPIEMFAIDHLVGVDFADVRTVMHETGVASLGIGYATGDNRAQQATMQALSHPLLEDIDLGAVAGVLVKITADLDFAIEEFEAVCNIIKTQTSFVTTVVCGCKIVPGLQELSVTLLATGVKQPKNIVGNY